MGSEMCIRDSCKHSIHCVFSDFLELPHLGPQRKRPCAEKACRRPEPEESLLFPICAIAPRGIYGRSEQVGARSREREEGYSAWHKRRWHKRRWHKRRSERRNKRLSERQKTQSAVVRAGHAVAGAARDRLQGVAVEAPQARLAVAVAVTDALAPVAPASATSQQGSIQLPLSLIHI